MITNDFYSPEVQGAYELHSIGDFELEEGGSIPDLVLHEMSILGSPAYADDHPATIEMVAGGKVDPCPPRVRRPG